jgi:hypothetical protein
MQSAGMAWRASLVEGFGIYHSVWLMSSFAHDSNDHSHVHPTQIQVNKSGTGQMGSPALLFLPFCNNRCCWIDSSLSSHQKHLRLPETITFIHWATSQHPRPIILPPRLHIHIHHRRHRRHRLSTIPLKFFSPRPTPQSLPPTRRRLPWSYSAGPKCPIMPIDRGL